MATIVLESQAETVRLAVFLACTHLWSCFHCQMPGARCSGGPRMGYRLRHWHSESGKTKEGCVYAYLSLQVYIETCSAWFAWNGLHLCMHDCSHLAYKALIGFEAFICSLPSWVHSLLWDLWDLTSAEVPSDSEVRGRRRKAKEVSCTLSCVVLQSGRILFDCTREDWIVSHLLLLYSQKRPTAERTASLLWFRLKAWVYLTVPLLGI